jgi:hypothetical protein
MPISSLQFDLGLDAKDFARVRRVHAFMRDHHEWAYSVAELAQEFGPNFRVDGHSLDEVVAFLADIGAVGERIVDGVPYYAYAADVEGLS